MIEEIRKQLELDEGRVRWVYKDSLGYWTIGVGCLVDERKGGGLRDNEIDFIFSNRLSEVLAEMSTRLPWTARLDDARKGALANMCFQMGVDGLMGFPHMLQSLQAMNYNAAYQECLDSDWHKQTPNRCEKVARQILTGVWQ